MFINKIKYMLSINTSELFMDLVVIGIYEFGTMLIYKSFSLLWILIRSWIWEILIIYLSVINFLKQHRWNQA